MSRKAHLWEAFGYLFQLTQFDPEKHLRGREEHDFGQPWLMADKIMIVRKNEHGWWREMLNFKNENQINKLIKDETVECGWIIEPRFNNKGGWDDW